jgi:type I restriction enzyme M protein
VLNGSPLFTGGAESGESNIRKWILDCDYLEAIIALPTDVFYNTGIATYIWVLATSKSSKRAGKVQLIDATSRSVKMRKSLGSKRNLLGTDDIAWIARQYWDFAETPTSKVFDRHEFYYRTITVERPLRLSFAATPERIDMAMAAKPVLKLDDGTRAILKAALESLHSSKTWKAKGEFSKALMTAVKSQGIALPLPVIKAVTEALSERDDDAEIVRDAKGCPEPDTAARDTENVPWDEDIDAYFDREVKPFLPDAWIDKTKTREGCEIPFARHFYVYTPPRPLAEIDRDLDEVLGRIRTRLDQVRA